MGQGTGNREGRPSRPRPVGVKAAGTAACLEPDSRVGTNLMLFALAITLTSPVQVSALPSLTTTPSLTYRTTIGGPAHAATYPSGLDVDSAGNVYVADTGNDQVAAYGSNGVQRWRVGVRALSGLTAFRDPRDVAFLGGNIYVADTGNGRVVVLDSSTGAALTQWTGFGSIMGISAGTSATGQPIVLLTQDQRNQVQVRTPQGGLIRIIGSGPGSGPGQLNAPRDAATDSHGFVYIADFLNNRLAKFSPSGGWLKNWGQTGTAPGSFQRPYGVDVDDLDQIYVADSNNGRIQKFDTEGVFEATWGTKGSGPGQFTGLRRVAVGSGTWPQVYGADLWLFRIVRFGQGGAVLGVLGGTAPPLGGFNEPSGIDVGAPGVLVADAVNQRIERFDVSQPRSFAAPGTTPCPPGARPFRSGLERPTLGPRQCGGALLQSSGSAIPGIGRPRPQARTPR